MTLYIPKKRPTYNISSFHDKEVSRFGVPLLNLFLPFSPPFPEGGGEMFRDVSGGCTEPCLNPDSVIDEMECFLCWDPGRLSIPIA